MVFLLSVLFWKQRLGEQQQLGQSAQRHGMPICLSGQPNGVVHDIGARQMQRCGAIAAQS
jgi:hypothetical protein